MAEEQVKLDTQKAIDFFKKIAETNTVNMEEYRAKAKESATAFADFWISNLTTMIDWQGRELAMFHEFEQVFFQKAMTQEYLTEFSKRLLKLREEQTAALSALQQKINAAMAPKQPAAQQ